MGALKQMGCRYTRQAGVSGGVRIWQSASSLFAFLRHGPVLRLVSIHLNTHPGKAPCVAPSVAVAVFFLVRASSRVEGEVLAVLRGFPLPRAVSELRSRG